jgi:hypothetical protein
MSKRELKRHQANMRTTKTLREKIKRTAAASGRSLAQGVEMRLEHSFWLEEQPSCSGSKP